MDLDNKLVELFISFVSYRKVGFAIQINSYHLTQKQHKVSSVRAKLTILLMKHVINKENLVLSTAYSTLIQSSTKLTYDMTYKMTDISHFSYEENNAVDIFEQVIRQVKETVLFNTSMCISKLIKER
jgi:hypothetical protein